MLLLITLLKPNISNSMYRGPGAWINNEVLVLENMWEPGSPSWQASGRDWFALLCTPKSLGRKIFLISFLPLNTISPKIFPKLPSEMKGATLGHTLSPKALCYGSNSSAGTRASPSSGGGPPVPSACPPLFSSLLRWGLISSPPLSPCVNRKQIWTRTERRSLWLVSAVGPEWRYWRCLQLSSR